jgi:hypothetical protein
VIPPEGACCGEAPCGVAFWGDIWATLNPTVSKSAVASNGTLKLDERCFACI